MPGSSKSQIPSFLDPVLGVVHPIGTNPRGFFDIFNLDVGDLIHVLTTLSIRLRRNAVKIWTKIIFQISKSIHLSQIESLNFSPSFSIFCLFFCLHLDLQTSMVLNFAFHRFLRFPRQHPPKRPNLNLVFKASPFYNISH